MIYLENSKELRVLLPRDCAIIKVIVVKVCYNK